VSLGETVVWANLGTLPHDLKANTTTAGSLAGFSLNLTAGASRGVAFLQTGTLEYYESNYSWMKGMILVTPSLPPPPPMPTAFQVDLSGNVGWTVEGLSSSEVNLLVSHSLDLSVFLFKPVTESGTLVQSIDLSTRVESAGTATDLIEHVLTGLAATTSGSSLSGAGNVWSQMIASTSSDPSYTFWWVNGPLSTGTALQVMDGWASVTGSESFNAGSLGTVSAWIVTSQFAQSFNTNIPNPSNPFTSGSTASATSNINLLWSYDKGSDLLLRSLANATLTMHSVSSQQVFVNPCAPNSYCPTYASVKVTRDTRLVLTLSLRLSNTSLRLDQRMANGAQSQDLASLLSSMMATPWSVFGVVGGTAAAIIGLSIWLGQKARKSGTPNESSAPSTEPSTSILPSS